MFSQSLIRGLQQTSQDVAMDLGKRHGRNAEVVASGTIEILDMRCAQSRSELTRLCAEHGYDRVLAEAKKHVSTW